MKVIGFILCLVVIANCFSYVVDKEKYMEKLFKHVVTDLVGFPGTLLTLDDFDTAINNSTMEKTFNGNVRFHSGFVSRIGKMDLSRGVTLKWDDEGVRIEIFPFEG